MLASFQMLQVTRITEKKVLAVGFFYDWLGLTMVWPQERLNGEGMWCGISL